MTNPYLDMAQRLAVIKKDFQLRLQLTRKAQTKTVSRIRRLKKALRRAHEIADLHNILLSKGRHQDSISTLSDEEQNAKSNTRDLVLWSIEKYVAELSKVRKVFHEYAQDARQMKKNVAWLSKTINTL